MLVVVLNPLCPVRFSLLLYCIYFLLFCFRIKLSWSYSGVRTKIEHYNVPVLEQRKSFPSFYRMHSFIYSVNMYTNVIIPEKEFMFPLRAAQASMCRLSQILPPEQHTSSWSEKGLRWEERWEELCECSAILQARWKKYCTATVVHIYNKKAVLPQANRAMPHILYPTPIPNEFRNDSLEANRCYFVTR